MYEAIWAYKQLVFQQRWSDKALTVGLYVGVLPAVVVWAGLCWATLSMAGGR